MEARARFRDDYARRVCNIRCSLLVEGGAEKGVGLRATMQMKDDRFVLGW